MICNDGKYTENIIDERKALFTKDYIYLGKFNEGCIPAKDEETDYFTSWIKMKKRSSTGALLMQEFFRWIGCRDLRSRR